nr:tRNA pseudouridine synthase-like 1 isoform X2 [Danaus plexippus plexippus]
MYCEEDSQLTVRSSEKIWLKEGRYYPDPESIQGLMELALLKIKPLNYPNVFLSSRTDGGVHALNTCAHFDLERHKDLVYEPAYLEHEINKYFFEHNISIQVNKCLQVNDDFNARHDALSRTYLYRLAVIKPEIKLDEKINIATLIPIEEWRRCHFIKPKIFDIELFKEGAKYFVGYHDFTTFKRFDKLKAHKHNRREIKSINIKQGSPCVTSYSTKRDSCFNYWDIEVHGRSFVHNQIRRMIGTLISVASGKLQPKDIQVMLQVPSKHSWHSFIQNCPPDGLYLADVEYKQEDLIYDPNRLNILDSGHEFLERIEKEKGGIEERRDCRDSC